MSVDIQAKAEELAKLAMQRRDQWPVWITPKIQGLSKEEYVAVIEAFLVAVVSSSLKRCSEMCP